MLEFLKAFTNGILNGYKWYGRRIRESQWWIIPMIFDTATLPLKFIIIPIMCATKRGRKLFISLGQDMDEE